METIIIENVRGQWVVDKNSTDVFEDRGCAYGDGALLELETVGSKSLCCHPDSPAVCKHKG